MSVYNDERKCVVYGRCVSFAFSALLFVLSAFLAAYYFIGPFGSDDLQYVQLATGGAPHLGTARYAVSAFYAAFAVFTSVQLAAYAFFLYAFLLALATYLLTMQFVNSRVGATAALLVAANPIVFYYSGAIFPDNPLALFYLLHIGLFANYVWLTRRVSSALLSGAALAGCYATKEASLVFALPTVVVGFWLLLTQRATVWRGVVAFSVGFIAGVGADMAISAALFGDPFYRLTYSRDHEVLSAAAQIMNVQGTHPFTRLSYIAKAMLSYWPGPALAAHAIAVLFFPVVAWRWCRPHMGPAMYVSASAFMVVAYLTWGTVSVRDYVGVPLQVRYYTPAIAPASIAIAVLLWWAAERMRPAIVGRVIVVLVVALMTLSQLLRPAPHAGKAYRAREVLAIGRAVVFARANFPAEPIVGDSYVSTRYSQYGPQMGVLPMSGLASLALGDFVFVTAASNSKASVELAKLKRCSASLELVRAPEALRLPRNRNSDIGLMIGAASYVRFEEKNRVELHRVQGLVAECYT